MQTIDWSRWLTPRHTLAVDCNVRDSTITHSQYAARRVKDAICDQFVARVGIRPSVDPEEPMLGFNLHVYRNQATLSLDSLGHVAARARLPAGADQGAERGGWRRRSCCEVVGGPTRRWSIRCAARARCRSRRRGSR
ncbi:MAG: THUMP domain-containing protein [Gemmataceae bacterium]